MQTEEENYFDHDADIGIIGRGSTIEECFVDAAKTMFSLMADLSVVKQNKSIHIAFNESDLELALVTWLNLLIAKSQAENLILSHFHIVKNQDQWQGEANGEIWRDDIERGIDVKGATLTMLSVKKINGQWQAQCVVDV